MSLASVERITIARRLVGATESTLREAGRMGLERFVLWTGVVDGATFDVRNIHVPAQRAYRLASGLCVTVDGPALHALNVWLYEHGQVLGVQIHTHGTDAYHSDTDSTYAIVTEIGGASLVVPGFCAGPLLGAGLAAYRLEPEGWVASRPGLIEVV